MSSDNQSTNNHNNNPPGSISSSTANDMSRNRRASITPFTSLFQRSNSTSAGTPAMPGPITTAAINDQRRRLSVSTVGLSGTSPTGIGASFGLRRGSLSTNGSESIDENAVEEDDFSTSARTAPATPFTRRMSFGAQAMRNMRAGGGNSPGSNDQGYNWSEQLRSRAESSVAAGSRPSFPSGSGMGTSPPRAIGGGQAAKAHHDRAKSAPDMPTPPAQTPKPRAERRKPDAFQERILKGDFYMD